MSLFWLILPFSLLLEVAPVAQVLVAPGQHPEKIEKAPLNPVQREGKWGYVDLKGKLTIAAQFESAGIFSEGVAPVELNKRFGYIDTQGNFVIHPTYFKAGSFKEGFAWVMTKKPWTPFGAGEYGFVARLGQGTFINHSGRELRPAFPIAEVSSFSEALAAVRPGNGKVGYLNTHGEWSIKPRFDEAHDFSEGLAAVNQGAKGHMGGRWGYIDKDGVMIIPPQYDYAGQFKSGHACVEEAGQWKLIDAGGNGGPIDKAECLR